MTALVKACPGRGPRGSWKRTTNITAQGKDHRRTSVQTVDKALSVLEFLSGQPQGRRGSEIARALGFHPATTHRLLSTLEARGYVRKDPVTKCYTLGLKCLELGGAVLASIELPSIARPYLEALQAETGETVHLMINDRGQGIYLTKIESEHRVRMASQLGRRSYLHCTAVGKAMLAFMDEKEVDAIIEEHGLPRFTPNTITDKEILKKELLTIRAGLRGRQRRGRAGHPLRGRAGL